MSNSFRTKSCRQPIDAVVAVTYRCNSRCIMCNIWQIKDYPELEPAEYLKLPSSLRDVNISGGEAFLREDLVEIVRNVRQACPRAQITISSNGFLVDVIRKQMPLILAVDPRIAVSISVDGIGQMHEEVRRVPSAWLKVTETLRYLRHELGLEKHRVKLAFTLNNINCDHLERAYDYAREMGVEFSMAIVHSSDLYFSATNELQIPAARLDEAFSRVISDLRNSLNPKDWARAYFVDGLLKVAKGEKRPLQSFGGEDFFYLDPRGDVYPSVVDNVIMGNLRHYDSFTDFWCSESAHDARESVRGFENNYWMVCTARTAMRRNPLKVAKWVLFGGK